MNSCIPDTGPFANVKSFHDWFSLLSSRENANPLSFHPMRPGLPDNVSINFTHGDLHPSNILITPEEEEGQARILALIDFEQSGWYPAYWEYCKARWTAEIGGEWGTLYIPRFLEPHDEAYKHWDYFCLILGV